MNPKKAALIPLLLVAVFTFFALQQIPLLRFDYHFESFFPSDDPELEFFNDFKEKFGNDNDYILIGIREENGIFSQPFLQKISSLSDALQEIGGIERVVSPTNLSFFVSGPFGPVQVKFLHPEDPDRYTVDSARIYQVRELTAPFFSDSALAVNLILQTVKEPSKAKSDSIVDQLNEVLSRFEFEEIHVAGKVPAQHNYIDRMQTELMVFISLAVLLLVILLTVMFRSFWGVVIPLVIVFLSIIWLLGIMGASGKDIDLIMTLMPTMLFVVGISDAIHVLSRFTESIRAGIPKYQAIRLTVREIGAATFLTSLTTAVGFLSLITASIIPLKEFGIYIAIGVGVAFVLTFLIFPPVLLLVKPPGSSKMNIRFSEKWGKWMRVILRISFQNKRMVVGVTLILLIISVAGISRIDVNSFLLEDLRKDDPLKEDFLFLEENFGGVRPNEVVISVLDSSRVWDYENVVEIARVSDFIENYYNTSAQTSIVSLVKLLNQAINGGNTEYYRIPGPGEYPKVKAALLKMRKSSLVNGFITQDGKFARISGRMEDLGSRGVALLDKQFYRNVPALADTSRLDFHLTGTARLIDKNISYLSVNMVQGLGVAFLLIALISGIMFRSLRMVVFSLIPNIIPLVLIGGIMGFLDVDLKVSTSIIFTIAFGIAVDDTIHFLSRFRLELRNGTSVPWAIRRSMNVTGKAIILTSIVLVTGFITLIFSNFEGTWLVGFLISLTLLFAVLGDLLLLPILLLAFRRRR